MELAPTTELEAVNALLKAVGETPINSLDNLGFTDAAIARDTLRSKWREVLSRGWYFNRDDDYAFTPDAEGRVQIPPAAISLRPSRAETRRLIPRNGFIWNADDQTDVFTADAPPVVNVVWLFDFERIPESARNYITAVAAMQFQAQFQGSDQSYGYTKDDVRLALMALGEEERLYEPKANMFNDSTNVSEIHLR